MLRKKLFLIGFFILCTGIGLALYFMFVPMQGDNQKITLPAAGINKHKKPKVDSPQGHNKSSQKVMLINAEPIAVSAFSNQDIQLHFSVNMPDAQSVKIEATTDKEITIEPSQRQFDLNDKKSVTYRFTLNTSISGKFYIMFHSYIETSTQSIPSAPTAILIEVVE